MQEQENSVFEINEIEGCGTKIFSLWSKNGLSCKEINLTKVNFY